MISHDSISTAVNKIDIRSFYSISKPLKNFFFPIISKCTWTNNNNRPIFLVNLTQCKCLNSFTNSHFIANNCSSICSYYKVNTISLEWEKFISKMFWEIVYRITFFVIFGVIKSNSTLELFIYLSKLTIKICFLWTMTFLSLLFLPFIESHLLLTIFFFFSIFS